MKKRLFSKQVGGFTLIELLLVIGILAILAVGVFAALNPAKRFRDARNARRTTDVETLLSAVHSYIVDSNVSLLPGGSTAPVTEVQIGTGGSGCAIATGGCAAVGAACLDLSGQTGMNSYLASNPIDPSGGTTYVAAKTGYTYAVSSAGIVTVRACAAEGTTISSSR